MDMRIGVIGVGSIGTAHARDLAFAVSGATVSAVFDVDEVRRTQLAAELDCAVPSSAAELISSPDVDAVVIASPDRFHGEQVLACLAAGKPALCEKPLSPTQEEARTVLEAEVATGGRLITMGFMRRFDPGYLLLREELQSGAIGEPLLVHNVHRNASAPYGLTSAGTLANSAVHELDINRWLLGEEYVEVLVVAGRAAPRTPDGERDPLLVLLRTESGVLVEIEAFANAGYGYEVTCQVSGSEGSAQMGQDSLITRSAYGRRGQSVPDLWIGRFREAYRRQLQGWVDHLRGRGPQVGAGLWDGYVATVVAGSAIESLKVGGWVPVALPPQGYRSGQRNA
jgi:myo-inositol 2-dehydrogenase/D-chiro-inositol 1-dehydrogenase